MRWWRVWPSRSQARRKRVLVAIAPSRSGEHPGAPRGERVVDRDHPAVGFRRGTDRAEVAAEIDERAASADAAISSGGDEVGGVTLPDPAEVERDAGRERDREQACVELDRGASRSRCGCDIGSGPRTFASPPRRSRGRIRRRPPPAGRWGRSARRCPSTRAPRARPVRTARPRRPPARRPRRSARRARSSGRKRLHCCSSRSIVGGGVRAGVGRTVEDEHGHVGAHGAEPGCSRLPSVHQPPPCIGPR